MHPAEDHRNAAPRGIIVLDTCALLNLCVPIPENYITKHARTFGQRPQLSDALFYLAEQGYQIIIPEMVAHEAGSYTRDATTIHTHFDTSVSRVFCKITSNFFHKVHQGAFEPTAITIEPPLANDTSADANLLNTLYALHSDPNLTRQEKRQGIIEVGKQHKHSQHAGETAAFKLIQSLHCANTPVYFLSDDVLACETLMQMKCTAPVHVLGSAGFYTALQKNNVLSKLGIMAADYQEIGRTMRHPGGRENQRLYNTTSYLDNAQDPTNPASCTFLQSLRQRVRPVVAELRKEEPTENISPPPPEKVVHKTIHQGDLKALVKRFGPSNGARHH